MAAYGGVCMRESRHDSEFCAGTFEYSLFSAYVSIYMFDNPFMLYLNIPLNSTTPWFSHIPLMMCALCLVKAPGLEIRPCQTKPLANCLTSSIDCFI